MKLVDVTSGTMGGSTLRHTVDELRERFPEIELMEGSSEALDSSERTFQAFLGGLEGADLAIIHLHAGAAYFRKFDRLRAALAGKGVPTFVHSNIPEEMEEMGVLFPFPPEDHVMMRSFIELGGEKNERGMVLWALSRVGGRNVEVPAPVRSPTEGYYHPDHPRFVSAEEFLRGLDGGLPAVGILFPQSQMLSGDLAVVDALVRALERRGAAAVPVFFTSSPSDVSGSLGAAGTVARYLRGPGGSIVRSVIINAGFSQLALSNPGDGARMSMDNFFQTLGVPVVQAMTTMQSVEAWQNNDSGLAPMELAADVVWPEFDGQIISVPVGAYESGREGKATAVPIADRVEKVAEMALSWGLLRTLPPERRRVAILMHQNPPRCDQVGGAFGLDAPESVAMLLKELSDEGYLVEHVPTSGDEVVREVLDGVSNDLDWLSPEEVAHRAAGRIEPSLYAGWFGELPQRTREAMCRDWGEPPGEVFVSEGRLLVPGVMNGNVFIGLQPPRGLLEKASELYHSTEVTMPHNYLAYYRWLKEAFGANVIVHMGTHGTLEWLPGKSVGLSAACPPDAVLDGVPHLYPYVIGNPGEGMQAKRRSEAVIIDHLIPALTRAGSYGELADLDEDIQEFFHAREAGQERKASSLLEPIGDRLRALALWDDLGLSPDVSAEELGTALPSVYDYISQLKDGLIKDGLHVLGRPPRGEQMTEMVRSLTRLCNGGVPSLREAVAEHAGMALDDLLQHPSEIAPGRGMTNGGLLEGIEMGCRDLVDRLAAAGFDPALSVGIAQLSFPGSEKVARVADFICSRLVPDLARTSDEMAMLLHGLSGGYVPPGPSGCVSRGNAHLLPTGRNFYSIDPSCIPTASSWEMGRAMAEQMVARHVRDKGGYPESVGMVIFASDTMKTGGDDIAYILWLMGLRPVRSCHGGVVHDLEVIPLQELGRPRIDVTLRITGLFRDVFPGLVDLIDDGVRMIGSLNESDEENYLVRHMREEMVRDIASGIPETEARSKAMIRIFGCPPGGYGGGVSELVETSKWESREDLARSYVSWGCHAYGRGLRGERRPELFQKRLGSLDVTVKNHESRELDILEIDDDYIYLGGMNAAASTFGDGEHLSLMGDSSDPGRPLTRTVAEEAKFVMRSRVLNPKWLEGMKRHGYRGAQEVSQMVDFTFGWDATMDIVEPWMYQAIAEHFVFDDETRRWLENVNPYALRQVAGRLLEAVQRGMWDADDRTKERLQDAYLRGEDAIEGMDD